MIDSARLLGKRYGERQVLADVSFTLQPGAVTALIGANGAGKTTLLKRMLGLVFGDGETLFDGRRYEELPDPAATVGVALDVLRFDPTFTAHRYLAWVAKASGTPLPAVDDMLAALDLRHVAAERIRKLSFGTKQRLNLAAALLPDPEVLILDEPGIGMDPAGLHWLRRLARDRADQGDTVLVSSHLLADIEACADRILLLDHGALLFHGSVTEFVRLSPSPRVVVRCEAPSVLASVLRQQGRADVVEKEDGALIVRGMPVHAVAEVAVTERVVLHSITPEHRSVGEAYFDRVRTHRTRDREKVIGHVPA